MKAEKSQRGAAWRIGLLCAAFAGLLLLGFWAFRSQTPDSFGGTEAPLGTNPVDSNRSLQLEVLRPTKTQVFQAQAPQSPDDVPLEGTALYRQMNKPFRIGVVVPEDFVLPPGYVRHYQMNEDGTALPAILMYHPDFRSLSDSGVELEIPEDRIVPPDSLPVGLKSLMLEVPRVVFDGGIL
jgi:hypothetical protein